MSIKEAISNVMYFFLWLFEPKQTGAYPVVNGAPASKSQLELAYRMGVRDKHINYKVCGYFIDIALPKQRIAVEYDSIYFHKNTYEKDRARAAKLAGCGWKVLSIYTDKIPPAEFVFLEIEKLKKSKKMYRRVSY